MKQPYVISSLPEHIHAITVNSFRCQRQNLVPPIPLGFPRSVCMYVCLGTGHDDANSTLTTSTISKRCFPEIVTILCERDWVEGCVEAWELCVTNTCRIATTYDGVGRCHR